MEPPFIIALREEHKRLQEQINWHMMADRMTAEERRQESQAQSQINLVVRLAAAYGVTL